MSDSTYIQTVTGVLVAATSKIPIEFAPASTANADLIDLDITFDTVFSATYPLIEFCTYGTVGSGGTTPTPGLYGNQTSLAANTVVRINDTTAPTTITPIWSWYWSAGFLWPLGREFNMAASGKYCIRITSPAASNFAINAIWSE